ncbi:hypothetical protein EF910_05420 [Streptomyces sp. WAC07149]|nr:hypothetical protein EF910_05420 [Streptomyces sp. WAC07149]
MVVCVSRFSARRDDIEPGPIREVLRTYYPHWDAPDYRPGWVKCLCPAHDEATPSASVNFDQGCVNCQACDFRGTAYSIIMREEGCTFSEAQRRAEEAALGSGEGLPRAVRRVAGRRVFGGTPLPGPGDGRAFQPRVRRRFGA